MAEGYEGSYPSVARHLDGLRGPRLEAAAQVGSTRIETGPAEECQFDSSKTRAPGAGSGDWARCSALGE